MKNQSLISIITLFSTINLVAQKKDDRPNILIIMADDLDMHELGCYGGKNVATPNIDDLARKGLKFNNLYCSEAISGPTRSSLLTGLYPARNGAFQNHKQIFKETELVSKYLENLGYNVALTGKDDCPRDRKAQVIKIIEGFEPGCTKFTADYQVDTIKKYISQSTKPFCLFVMSTLPHTPWSVGNSSVFDPNKIVLPPNVVDTKNFRDLYCKYLAEIAELDNQVRDVKKTLKESGKEKNTIFIFLGEQGAAIPGGKWTLYDYGIKSAFIANYPGIIKEGVQTDAIVQYEDITPTLIDIAGGKAIEKLDGKSFLNVLYGKANTHREYAYGIHNHVPAGVPFPIRSIRNLKYKLVYNLKSDAVYSVGVAMSEGIHGGYWKSWKTLAENDKNAERLVNRIQHHPEYELYDIVNDPYELNNIIDKPELKSVVKKLKENLESWMKQQNDTGIALDDISLQPKKTGKKAEE